MTSRHVTLERRAKKNPSHNKNIYLSYDSFDLVRAEHLHHVIGVVEWYRNESERILVVKYDTNVTNKETILAVLS